MCLSPAIDLTCRYNKAGVGQKAARRSKASGDEKDGSKRRAEEAFMSPLEVMRQKYKRKKASATTRQKDTLSKLVSLLPRVLSCILCERCLI
eukprot:COSAG05_NODE_20_length_33177_cov_336.302639_23_plen_92_part_00